MGMSLLGALILLSACGGANRFEELRHEEPSRYYLYVPEIYNSSQQWPMFVAIHDVDEDSQDCIRDWYEIAEENQVFLLCPEFASNGGEFDRSVDERILADILNQLYQDYSLRTRFFLTGKNSAASFILRYAYRYPQAIDGVSAINPQEYPDRVQMVSFPILLIVERGDSQAIESGNEFIQSLSRTGTQTRLLEIDNLGSGIPYGVQRLTIELFEQVSR
jgi:predicted peptidase